MRKLLWAVSGSASLIAGFVLVAGVTAANGAPQEASAAAIAIAVAVIPYVLARAWEGLGSDANR